MTTTSNLRIAEAEREKTSLELPKPLSAALYQKIDELLEEVGEITSRPELLAALMLLAVRMDSSEMEQMLRDYRRARLGELACQVSDKPRRGRPRIADVASLTEADS
jgi:hypothetical protein